MNPYQSPQLEVNRKPINWLKILAIVAIPFQVILRGLCLTCVVACWIYEDSWSLIFPGDIVELFSILIVWIVQAIWLLIFWGFVGYGVSVIV